MIDKSAYLLRISQASPAGLVVINFELIIEFLNAAIENDFGENVQKAKDGLEQLIQSLDFSAGRIRYLQCTDEAPLAERGVHESFIRFNPGNTAVSLSDPALVWSQNRYPPFPGEQASPFSDDGKRYRAYPELGGGRVVRLRAVSEAIEKIR